MLPKFEESKSITEGLLTQKEYEEVVVKRLKATTAASRGARTEAEWKQRCLLVLTWPASPCTKEEPRVRPDLKAWPSFLSSSCITSLNSVFRLPYLITHVLTHSVLLLFSNKCKQEMFSWLKTNKAFWGKIYSSSCSPLITTMFWYNSVWILQMVIVFASVFHHVEAEKQPAFLPQSASVWHHQNVWSVTLPRRGKGVVCLLCSYRLAFSSEQCSTGFLMGDTWKGLKGALLTCKYHHVVLCNVYLWSLNLTLQLQDKQWRSYYNSKTQMPLNRKKAFIFKETKIYEFMV